MGGRYTPWYMRMMFTENEEGVRRILGTMEMYLDEKGLELIRKR